MVKNQSPINKGGAGGRVQAEVDAAAARAEVPSMIDVVHKWFWSWKIVRSKTTLSNQLAQK